MECVSMNLLMDPLKGELIQPSIDEVVLQSGFLLSFLDRRTDTQTHMRCTEWQIQGLEGTKEQCRGWSGGETVAEAGHISLRTDKRSFCLLACTATTRLLFRPLCQLPQFPHCVCIRCTG